MKVIRLTAGKATVLWLVLLTILTMSDVEAKALPLLANKKFTYPVQEALLMMKNK